MHSHCRCYDEQHKCDCSCHEPDDPFFVVLLALIVLSFVFPILIILYESLKRSS